MNQAKGFTLVELMIVLVIVGILSAVGFGFYGDNVRASNRTEGRSALAQSAASLEKCKSLYGAYNINANCAEGTALAATYTTDTDLYTISAALAATTFTLTATPVDPGPQASDADCTTMTLTNTGVKAGTGAVPADCW